MRKLATLLLAIYSGAASAYCCDPCCLGGTGYSGGGWRYNPPGWSYVHNPATPSNPGAWKVNPDCPRGCKDREAALQLLPTEPTGAGPAAEREVIVLWRASVFFATDRAEITSFEDRALRLLARQHQESPKADVLLATGHASAEGPSTRNVALAARRVDAVRLRLEALGVPADRIRVDHHGASQARAAASDPEALRQLDRRVDVTMQEPR